MIERAIRDATVRRRLPTALAFALVGLVASRTPGAVQQATTAACAPEILGPQPYEQRIARTATHCRLAPNRCGAAKEEDVAYVWPASGDPPAPKRALLRGVAPIFTQPFRDARVRLWAGWLYAPGRWHMAADYGIDGDESFEARAAAPGRVVFAGWDGFSGNTVVISHDQGGEMDAYRTISMHLRDGAAHDCAASWRESVARAPQGSPLLASYKAQLEQTGCTADPAKRRPDPRFWGTERQTLALGLLGRRVNTGDSLGWAGDTGPGGFATRENPNVHLHVFFARRDPADGAWVLFDPWGIYGEPTCYPQDLADKSARGGFPSAWKAGPVPPEITTTRTRARRR